MKDHVCLSYRRPRNGHIRNWRFAGVAAAEAHTPDPALIFNSGEALIAAATAGLGLVQVAEYYARPALNAGALVELLPDFKTHAYDISVVFQQRKSISPRLRVFIDFLVEIFSPRPW